MWPSGHWEHDSWDVRYPPPSPPYRHVSRHPHRYSGNLIPEPHFATNLHRSHSQGHVPRPTNIHIHNEVPVTQDTHTRAESRPPPQAPPPPMASGMAPPMMVPVFADPRIAREDLLWQELNELKLQQSRSRSRGRSAAGDRPDNSEWLQWQLAQRDKDAAAAEQKRQYEEERKRIQMEYDLRAAEEENRRRIAEAEAAAEHQRIIDDYENKRRQDAQKAEDAEAAFKLNMQIQAQETREREKKAYEDFVRRQKDQEEEEERRYKEYLRRQAEKEEAEERKYQDFLRKQKEREEAEEAKKKEEEAKINATMKERLRKLGYSESAIEIMIDPDVKDKKEKKQKRKSHHREHSHSPHDADIIVVPPPVSAPTDSLVVHEPHGHVPVYPRIHRSHLDIETLEYYKVPWDFDRANKEYIIIHREMSKYETDILFEHTSRIRRNGGGRRQQTPNHNHNLLIEEKKKEPKYAWVRSSRNNSNRSRSRGRDLRVLEIRRS